MKVSLCTAALARVSVTVAPERVGVPLKGASCAVPPEGVLRTVNALLARFAAAARVSVNVTTSAAPLTVAEANVGAVMSFEATGPAASLPIASSVVSPSSVKPTRTTMYLPRSGVSSV